MNKTDVSARRRVATKELLKNAGIERVVFVDDKHGISIAVGEMVGWAASPANSAAATHVLGGRLVPGSDDFADDLRELLNNDPDGELSKALRLSVESSGGENDFKAFKELDALFDDVEYKKLLPSQWQSEKAALINDAVTKGTLFLFDQQLSDDNGLQPTGADLIKDAITVAGDGAGRMVLAILSYKISLSNEQDWLESHGLVLPQVAVAPISKEAIDKPDNFACRLKITLLGPGCRALQQISIQAITEAHSEVSADILKLYELAFDHAVLKVSEDEGSHEADAVIRLYEALLRNRARKKLRNNEQLALALPALRDLSQRLRKPNLEWSDPQISSATYAIQRMERFDTGEFINSSMLPIDIGDVFEDKSKPVRRFILVAPQCDLMVRSSGRRKAQEGTLLEVDDKAPSQVEQKDRMKVELAYFGEPADPQAWIDLRKPYSIKLWVLDLCAFNTDGLARMDLSAAVPTGHTAAWTDCYRYVQNGEASTALSDLTSIGAASESANKKARFARSEANKKDWKDLSDALSRARALCASATHSDLFPPSASGKTLTFELRRIDRLSPGFAYDVYRAYAAYQTRVAEDAVMVPRESPAVTG